MRSHFPSELDSVDKHIIQPGEQPKIQFNNERLRIKKCPNKLLNNSNQIMF